MSTGDDLTPTARLLPRFGALAVPLPGYRPVHRLDLESPRLLIHLNLIGLALMLAGLVGLAVAAAILDALALAGPNPLMGVEPLPFAALTLIGIVIMLALHELCHGLAFQVFGARSRYGFSMSKGVAFATSGGYYLTRDAYSIVALAPLVLITFLSVCLMALTSGETRTLIALIGAANIGGSVGDVWFYRVCRRFPPHVLVHDFGEGADLLLPPSESEPEPGLASGQPAADEVCDDHRQATGARKDEDQRAPDAEDSSCQAYHHAKHGPQDDQPGGDEQRCERLADRQPPGGRLLQKLL